MFTKRAKRHLVAHQKFYYFDAGVFSKIRPTGHLDQPSEISGHAVETLVAQHLRAWLEYSTADGKLYFWRTKNGLEVDFIVYGEIGFYALEVKFSTAISPQDLRGLHEFKQDYPECSMALLYGGNERIMVKNILCIPISDFLLSLRPNNPLF